jgi:hypothetical protein
MKIKKGFLIFILTFLAPSFALAESTCSVEPFTTTVSQGEAANISVLLYPDDMSADFEVSLGSLPNAVESGFLNKENIEIIGKTRKLPLIIETKQSAQMGSFMVAIIYKTREAQDFICQFNLEIEKNIGASVAELDQKVQNVTSKSITFGTLGVQHPPFTKKLVRKSVGKEVTVLQERLRILGFFPKNQSSTGYFGSITEHSVKEFQKSRGIEVLGIVGPKTRKALNELTY